MFWKVRITVLRVTTWLCTVPAPVLPTLFTIFLLFWQEKPATGEKSLNLEVTEYSNVSRAALSFTVSKGIEINDQIFCSSLTVAM